MLRALLRLALLLLTCPLAACAGAQQAEPPRPLATAAAASPTKAPVQRKRPHPSTLLRGGTLWTATGAVLESTDLLLQDNRIAAVGRNLPIPSGAVVVDVRGRIVTPGLVDMHSHLGVYAAPTAFAIA